ncbi:hypothetical protein IJ096_02790 [Candidatus Saccharibacteria bacterium]|nr:hypothetical protein [Candidatus Saccharibacteria bacterium]
MPTPTAVKNLFTIKPSFKSKTTHASYKEEINAKEDLINQLKESQKRFKRGDFNKNNDIFSVIDEAEAYVNEIYK